MPNLRLLLAATLLPLTLGCASGLHGGANVLKFHHADRQTLTAAPAAGDYVVAYRDHGSGELWQAPDSRRQLRKGDDLGFTRDDQGNLIAIAADAQKSLGPLPVTTQYACWYRLPDDYDASRRLRKGLRKTAAGAGAVALAGAAVVTTGLVNGLEPDHECVSPSDWLTRQSNSRPSPVRR